MVRFFLVDYEICFIFAENIIMARDNIKLINRFVDDFNLPVSVLDSPYFEYQLKLYDDN